MGSSAASYVLFLLFTLTFVLPISAAVIPAVERRDANGGPAGRTVVYFGQASGVSGVTLLELCSDPSIDVIVLGFVHIIKGKHDLPGLNLAGYCLNPIPGTDLHSCPKFGEAIGQCQEHGKQVLMSIGGSTCLGEPFGSDDDAVQFADSLWKLFGEGTGLESFRPFGNATVDGFDIDNESGTPSHYPKVISELRKKFSYASKKYYISAAPQCIRPDASIGGMVYDVDFLFIQFYNNPSCATTNLVDSFKAWSAEISAKSTAGTRLFVGLPGGPKAVGSGYVTPEEMVGYFSQIRQFPNFGGAMAWDAAYAVENTDSQGRNFLKAMKEKLSAGYGGGGGGGAGHSCGL